MAENGTKQFVDLDMALLIGASLNPAYDEQSLLSKVSAEVLASSGRQDVDKRSIQSEVSRDVNLGPSPEGLARLLDILEDSIIEDSIKTSDALLSKIDKKSSAK